MDIGVLRNIFGLRTLYFRFNYGLQGPAKGEIRALIKDIVYEAYPQCVVNKWQTEGDDMVLQPVLVHLDDELNALYKEAMASFVYSM